MNEPAKFISSDETGRLGARHLKRFWAQTLDARRDGSATAGRAEDEARFDKLILHALGLPIEETLQYLLQHAPHFDEFEDWILEKNGGEIERLQIERVNCVFSGEPYNEEIKRRLAEVEEGEDVLTKEDLEFWNENGYVIVRKAVSKTQARAAENAVWEFLEMNECDYASWYEKPIGKGIMMNFYHHPALVENRKSKRIQKAFAQIWYTADLWTTTDRTSFNPPETTEYNFQGPHIHWDMSLAPPFYFGTQGLLYLRDTPAEQGAFCCVPGFHRKLENWLENLPDGVKPRDIDLTHESVPIAAEAGDFVIWHQFLPHGSSPNRGKHPRIVQYINMHPPEFKENPNWL